MSGDPLQLITNFNNPANFDYDNTKIDVDAVNYAKLKLIDNLGQNFSQDFASDVGFIFNALLVEFLAGLVRQKDMLLPGMMCGATYNIDKDLQGYSLGNKTGTLFGGATVSGGRLNLAGYFLGKHVHYNAAGNANLGQTGCINIKFRTNYSGNPTEDQQIFSSGKLLKNEIQIYQWHGDGTIYARIRDKNTAVIAFLGGGVFNPIAGELNEWELNFNVSPGGEVRFLVNGVTRATSAPTATRDDDSTDIYLGRFVSGGSAKPNIYIEEWFVSSEVQHTADYIPSYDVPSAKYLESKVECPQFNYSGVGNIQAFTNFLLTVNNGSKCVVNDLWYSGGWIASDGSYAQSNTPTEILAQIATLPASDTLDVDIVFGDSNSRMDADDLSIDYTGQIYPTSDPTIVTNSGTDMDSLEGFVEDSEKPAGTEIKYVVVRNGAYLWFNTVSLVWKTSDGTYAQANTAVEIQTNKATLDLSLGYSCRIAKAFLHSDTGLVTPTLKTLAVDYGFFKSPLSQNKCWIYGYVKDNNTPVQGAEISIVSEPFWLNGNLSSLNEQFVSNSIGYFEKQLIETVAANVRAIATTKWTDQNGKTRKKIDSIIIPNEVSKELEDCISN